jgi:hypothetical protein
MGGRSKAGERRVKFTGSKRVWGCSKIWSYNKEGAAQVQGSRGEEQRCCSLQAVVTSL